MADPRMFDQFDDDNLPETNSAMFDRFDTGAQAQPTNDTMFDRFDEPKKEPQIELKQDGVFSPAKDLGVSVVGGANALLGIAGNLYGLTTDDMDNWATDTSDKNREILNSRKSERLRNLESERKARIDATDSNLGKAGIALWETISSPSLLTSFIFEQAPMMLPIGGVARGAGMLAEVAGATAKVTSKIATGAAVGTGAVMQGSDSGSQAYDQLQSISDEVWQLNPEVSSRTASGEALEDVKEEISLRLSRDSAIASGIVSVGVNMIPGARYLEQRLAGGKLPSTSRVANSARGFAGESVSEGLEESSGAYLANLMSRTINPEQDLMEGVGEAAGLGAAGGVFGAIAGATRSNSTVENIETDAENVTSKMDAATSVDEVIDIAKSETDQNRVEPYIGPLPVGTLESEQPNFADVNATDNVLEPSNNLPPILTQTKARHLRREIKNLGIEPDSPDYQDAVKKIEQRYDENYDQALAALPFEEYNALHGDTSESVNREDHRLLIEEFSAQADKPKPGPLPISSDANLEANVESNQEVEVGPNMFDSFDAVSQSSQLTSENSISNEPNIKKDVNISSDQQFLEETALQSNTVEDLQHNADKEFGSVKASLMKNEIQEIWNKAHIEEIDVRANDAATSPLNDLKQPNKKEKESGIYPKGHVNIHGLDITIENPRGSMRSGTDPDGNKWETKLQNHYGDLDSTTGADGDPVDVFIGSSPESDKVYVVDQVNKDGTFDEHKILVGFDNKESAIDGYKSNYEDGWTVGPVTEMSSEEFTKLVKTGDFTKPLSHKLAQEINLDTELSETKPSDVDQKQEMLQASNVNASPANDISQPLVSETTNVNDVKNSASKSVNASSSASLPSILTQTKARYLKAMIKQSGIKKGSPGYNAAANKLEISDYDAAYDNALSKISFEQYQELNNEIPDGINRQAYDQLINEVNQENINPSFTRAGEGGGETTATLGVDKDSLTPSVKPHSVLPINTVESTVSRLSKRLGLHLVKAKVVPTESELPADIKAQISKEGGKGGIGAVFHNKTIFIVADQMKSVAQVEESILHESAHNGGRILLGKNMGREYSNLFLKLGGLSGIKAKAIKAGFNMDQYFDIAADLLNQGKISSNYRHIYLVDEFLAHLNGQKAYDSLSTKVKQAIKEFYGAIRDILRKHELTSFDNYTDSDLAYLLKQINQASRDGAQNTANQPMFMYTGNSSNEDSEIDLLDTPFFSRNKATESEFSAENRRLREQDKTLWKKAKTVLRKQLSPGGLLPDSVFNEKIVRDSQFKVVEFDIKHLIGEFERAIKKDYLTRAGKLSDAQKEELSEALRGEIPPNLRESTKVIVVAMRAYIDKQSEQYRTILQNQFNDQVTQFDEGEDILFAAYTKAKAIKSGSGSDVQKASPAKAITKIMNTAKAEAKEKTDNKINIRTSMTKVAEVAERAILMQIITSNEGKYVHRSFQAFDDANWFKRVPTDVLDNARRYLIERYMGDNTSPEEAKRLTEVTIHEILKNGTAYDGVEAFVSESKLGAKDLSVLKKRKQISPEILALLGEYTDPRLNFAKTATKMGMLIWNTRFLDKVKEVGMGTFLFEGKNRPPEATAQIAGENTEAFAPMNGLWTTPEVSQAFKDALGKEQMANWYKTMIQVNGAVKFGKTILSPTTSARNWQSAFFFTLANGHFDLSHMKKSISGLREYLTHAGDAERLAYLRKLNELGVIYDTPYAGEMMRLLDDSKIENMISGSGVELPAKDALKLTEKIYQYGDDFWKIIGFENEKQMLIKHAELSESEAEIEAAERIRNTYPTYSMVGSGVQSLRRFPLAGTFVSFPAEIIRTSINMLKYLAKDMKNPKTRPLAMRRGAGLAIAAGYTFALQEMSKVLFDMDDDDEEAVRLQAAPWQKNSNLIFTGREDKGNLRYIDISFLDPYNYWKRPINAIMRDQPWEDKAVSAVQELVSPFLGRDILAGTIFEIMANKKESGGEIYKETDFPGRQLIDMADHLRKSIQPGIISNLERTWKALEGQTSSSGRKYNLYDEMLGWVGWRVTTLDPKTALYYRSYDFKDAKSDASRTLTEVLRDTNDIAPDDIAEAYERSLKMRQQAYADMSTLINAAKRSGMSDEGITQVLRGSLVSKADVFGLLNGVVPRWLPSRASERNAIKKAEAILGLEQVQVIQERYAKATQIGEELQPEETDLLEEAEL